jgi:hypothetical protein
MTFTSESHKKLVFENMPNLENVKVEEIKDVELFF